MAGEDLLSNLGDALNQQFLSGENKLKTAQLGAFANKYDRSAMRSYTEQGSFRNHSVDNTPKQLDILLQDPEATVLVKKRAFSSLAENFRPDLFDGEERLFLLATKTLFDNKCKQISSYEKLTKIAQISTQIGEVDYHLLPILFGAVDALESLGIGLNAGFKSVINQVRQIIAFNPEQQTTTWQSYPSSTNSFGKGSGVIEFTTATEISTTTTLDFNTGGRFQIRFADPYNLMTVTNNDIEAALSDANNAFYNNKGFQLLETVGQDTIDIQRRQLNLERAGRNVNPIRFIVEPETFVGKRIRAIIDVAGIEINFDSSSTSTIVSLFGGDGAKIDPTILLKDEKYNKEYGQEGLTPSEAGLFNNITSAMYNQMSLQANSRRRAQSANTEDNNKINNVRKKLRLHYANKLVIQPMDTVSIFISSKKKLDSKITGGLQSAFTGLKFMQGIGNVMQGIKDSFNTAKGYSIEKSVFVGNDFPNDLWLALRNQFVADKQGACVFTGFFDEATSNYSNGSYDVRTSGKDNSAFFQHGIVNIKPSMDVYNGPLYDPLTPFDLKYDSLGTENSSSKGKDPELLSENKEFFKSAFLKNSNGPMAGIAPTEQGYFSRKNTNKLYPSTISKGSDVRQPFYDPEGLTYRWKEGIATLVFGGDSYQPNPIKGNAITTDPFAGQDIMNILSLLITGEPYNYATYYKAATKVGSLARDILTGETSAASYFRGLRAEIKNRNAIYGDFVPFKMLTMDEASFEKIMSSQLRASSYDGELVSLTNQRASLADQYVSLGAGTMATSISSKIKEIDMQIDKKIKSIQDEVKGVNTKFRFLGNDISYDFSDFNMSKKSSPGVVDRKELRKKLKFLTRRLAWKVRANQDTNLFIIDDSYDKDYDLQAFEQTYADLSVFKSEYTKVSEQIASVSNKLKLEIFCNSQGHIEIRNPRYNSVPSSVLNKMFQQKDETGVQVFPQFLGDLFTIQIKDVYKQIEVLEDQLRLYCFMLGKKTDAEAEQAIKSFDSQSGLYIAPTFSFLSGDNGSIYIDIPTIKTISDPQYDNGLNQQLSSGNFSNIGKSKLIKSLVNPDIAPSGKFKSVSQMKDEATSDQRFKDIKDRLAQKSGQTFNIDQEFGINNNSAVKISGSSLAILQITNKIAQILADRERAIKTTSDALTNLKEGLLLDSRSGANKILFPSLSRTKSIPQMFEHMIEDESYDDIGVGSSSRYILKNRDIISYSISEKKPSFTAVRVNGNLDSSIPNNQLPSDMNVGDNGNLLSSAEAVDYDLWRMYGITLPQDVDAKFLHNPQAQMAPYAASLLTKARKEVLQGSITIVGNEYQQPGEVIYLENRDLLFYIDSITHTFSYGKSFQTSMTVGFGHNPGEYIPTPLDVIGKVLYKNNKKLPGLDHKKQGNVFNQENLGAVAVGFLTSGDIDIFTNKFADINKATLDQVIKQSKTSLAMISQSIKPILELRIYNNSESTMSSENDSLKSFANQLQTYLLGGQGGAGISIPSPGTKEDPTRLAAFKPTDQIRVVPVDCSSKIVGEFRYPSRKAFFLAKQIQNNKKIIQSTIDNNIYLYIIDIWITFNNRAK